MAGAHLDAPVPCRSTPKPLPLLMILAFREVLRQRFSCLLGSCGYSAVSLHFTHHDLPSPLPIDQEGARSGGATIML